jgi:hypothetical protein
MIERGGYYVVFDVSLRSQYSLYFYIPGRAPRKKQLCVFWLMEARGLRRCCTAKKVIVFSAPSQDVTDQILSGGGII